MTNATDDRAMTDDVATQLQALASSTSDLPPTFASAFAQAVQAMAAAVDYKDSTLMLSSAHGVFEACQSMFREAIQKEIGHSQRFEAIWRNVWKSLARNPSESFDRLRGELEARFDGTLKSLAELRDAGRLLVQRGYANEEAQRLDGEIARWRELQRTTLENWPRAHEGLPPVNRTMVAASRAAIAAGEQGELIDVAVRRLGCNTI